MPGERFLLAPLAPTSPAPRWLPEVAMRVIGDRLDMAYIRVLEVATFYTMFNLEPVGKHLIQVCGTTPCMLRGSGDLIKICQSRIGSAGTVSDDGLFSWAEVECLGACVNAPMVQISNAVGDHYYEDLDEVSMNSLLDELASGKAAIPGPRVDRQASAPIGESLTLIDKSLFDGSKAKKLKSIPNAPSKPKASKPKVAKQFLAISPASKCGYRTCKWPINRCSKCERGAASMNIYLINRRA